MDATELALLYSGHEYSVRIVDYESDGPETVHMDGGDAADRRMHIRMAAELDSASAALASGGRLWGGPGPESAGQCSAYGAS